LIPKEGEEPLEEDAKNMLYKKLKLQIMTKGFYYKEDEHKKKKKKDQPVA